MVRVVVGPPPGFVFCLAGTTPKMLCPGNTRCAHFLQATMADTNLVRRGAGAGTAAETGGMIAEEPLEQVSQDRLAQDLEAGGGRDNDDDATATSTTTDPDNEARPLSIERRYAKERMAAKVRNWKEGELAAGLVELTWRDELGKHRYAVDDDDDANGANRGVCADCCKEEMEPTCGCLFLSGLVCSRLGAGRVGNMAILRESTVMVEEIINDADESDEGIESEHDGGRPALSSNGSAAGAGAGGGAIRTRTVHRRKIDLVVGPYWPMLLCITYPLIFAVSTWTLVSAILPGRHPLVTLIWATLTLGLIYALFGVSFRDPGILPRHRTPPVGSGRGEWRWNDQAQTYRPRGAIYDPDCAVVIEGFDHTCPWTGTIMYWRARRLCRLGNSFVLAFCRAANIHLSSFSLSSLTSGTGIGRKNMPAFQAFVALVFICLIMDILLLTAAF